MKLENLPLKNLTLDSNKLTKLFKLLMILKKIILILR